MERRTNKMNSDKIRTRKASDQYTSGTLGTNAGVRVDVYVLFNDVTV